VGARLTAFVALLMGCFRQSKSRVALFLEQVLKQPCFTGWAVKPQNQATDASRPVDEELVSQLPYCRFQDPLLKTTRMQTGASQLMNSSSGTTPMSMQFTTISRALGESIGGPA
jgi:hypothetical protein